MLKEIVTPMERVHELKHMITTTTKFRFKTAFKDFNCFKRTVKYKENCKGINVLGH